MTGTWFQTYRGAANPANFAKIGCQPAPTLASEISKKLAALAKVANFPQPIATDPAKISSGLATFSNGLADLANLENKASPSTVGEISKISRISRGGDSADVGHESEVVNELTGGPSGLPDRTDWQCPAHARHRDFWVSDFGLKICATCHPDPRVFRAAWLASKDGAQ